MPSAKSKITAQQQPIFGIMLFRVLRNIVAKISIQQGPIAATPAVERGNSGNIEIVTDGVIGLRFGITNRASPQKGL
jgi:hypothetical protein